MKVFAYAPRVIGAAMLGAALVGAVTRDLPAVHAATDNAGAFEASADEAALTPAEDQLLGMINDYRQGEGLPTLQLSEILERAARWKAEALAQASAQGLSHDDVERTWRQRLLDFGYPEDAMVGENLGQFQGASLEDLMEAWKASPRHLANLRDPEWHYVGIANFVADDGTEFWVVDFGTVSE